MTRTTHIHPNATGGSPPACSTVVYAGERESAIWGAFTTSNKLNHSAIRTPSPLQGGLGRVFFGARYYDATLSIWLSVDPLAHKYPSMSAYMYCAGNPVMLVDPDGRDWFENELTGAVYNNSRMTKGQEGTGAMKGDGWVHLGENGMFTNISASPINAERRLVKNSGGNDEGTELVLRGKATRDLMGNQGYVLLPKGQTIYRRTFSVTCIFESKSVTSTSIEEIRITEKVGCFRKGTQRMGAILVPGPDRKAQFISGSHIDLTIQETVGRYIIAYERNPIILWGGWLANIITRTGGQHTDHKAGSPTTYTCWRRYLAIMN